MNVFSIQRPIAVHLAMRANPLSPVGPGKGFELRPLHALRRAKYLASVDPLMLVRDDGKGFADKIALSAANGL
jgi:hypothetical protein